MAERFMSYESFRGETVKKFLHCHGIPGTDSGNNGLYAAQRENFEAEKAGTETGNPDSRRAAVAEAHSRKYSPSAAAARMAGGDQWRVGDRAVPLISASHPSRSSGCRIFSRIYFGNCSAPRIWISSFGAGFFAFEIFALRRIQPVITRARAGNPVTMQKLFHDSPAEKLITREGALP